MPVWAGPYAIFPYEYIVLGKGGEGGGGSQGRSQIQLNPPLMPLCHTMHTIREYAICPYGQGHIWELYAYMPVCI